MGKEEKYMIAGIVIGCIVMLIVYGAAASAFEQIANEKGHEGYFWWCFLCGIVGWLMVAALPDRKQPQTVKSYDKSAEMALTQKPVASTQKPVVSAQNKDSFDDLPNL